MSRTFDGTTGCYFATNSLGCNTPSAAGWIKFTDNTVFHCPVSQWDTANPNNGSFSLVVSSTGWDVNSPVVIFQGSDGSANYAKGTTTLSTNTWYHVAGTYDGNTATVYLNGVSEGTQYWGSGSHSWLNGGGNPYIGRNGNSGPNVNGTTGDLAEVGVWDVCLTADEVLAMYQGVSPSKIRSTHLIGHWPLWGIGTGDELCVTTSRTSAGADPTTNTAVENGTITVGSDHPAVGPPVGANSQYGSP